MNKKQRLGLWLLLALIALALAGTALAAGGFELRSSQVGGGGGVTASGSFAMHSSVGQAAAERTLAGNYDLCSGFWCGAESIFKAFLPSISR